MSDFKIKSYICKNYEAYIFINIEPSAFLYPDYWSTRPTQFRPMVITIFTRVVCYHVSKSRKTNKFQVKNNYRYCGTVDLAGRVYHRRHLSCWTHPGSPNRWSFFSHVMTVYMYVFPSGKQEYLQCHNKNILLYYMGAWWVT